MRKLGKLIGDAYYIHKSAIHRIPHYKTRNAMKLLPSDFEFEIIKIHMKKNQISFIASPDWNTAHEPIVGDSYKVDLNTGEIKLTKGRKSNQQIYHHKWMFVEDSYTGFDVEESKKRSHQWENAGIDFDRKKIGNLNYWNEVVVSRL